MERNIYNYMVYSQFKGICHHTVRILYQKTLFVLCIPVRLRMFCQHLRVCHISRIADLSIALPVKNSHNKTRVESVLLCAQVQRNIKRKLIPLSNPCTIIRSALQSILVWLQFKKIQIIIINSRIRPGSLHLPPDGNLAASFDSTACDVGKLCRLRLFLLHSRLPVRISKRCFASHSCEKCCQRQYHCCSANGIFLHKTFLPPFPSSFSNYIQ